MDSSDLQDRLHINFQVRKPGHTSSAMTYETAPTTTLSSSFGPNHRQYLYDSMVGVQRALRHEHVLEQGTKCHMKAPD